MGMAEKEKQGFEAMDLRENNGNFAEYGNWVIMESGEDEHCEASMTTSTSTESLSINSSESSSSELAEDASSSSSSTSNCSLSSLSSGPLYELSELMANLPIKRGLSKFYQGKSQSFTSLASAKSLEDLAKRVNIPQRKKMMKSCKSYGGGLDGHKYSYSPKPIITKKPSKASLLSPLSKRNNGFF